MSLVLIVIKYFYLLQISFLNILIFLTNQPNEVLIKSAVLIIFTV